VQERLQAEGFNPGSADGVLKPETEAAIRQYQQKQGLPASGALDEATLRGFKSLALQAGEVVSSRGRASQRRALDRHEEHGGRDARDR
jgi:peptidoglycan hydrolase-like protein with peptidoglycan-binding domain